MCSLLRELKVKQKYGRTENVLLNYVNNAVSSFTDPQRQRAFTFNYIKMFTREVNALL